MMSMISKLAPLKYCIHLSKINQNSLRCLQFHLNKNSSTLSSTISVRKPINNLESNDIQRKRNIYLTSVCNGWTKDIGYCNKLWTTEKLISTLLMAIIPITITFPSQYGDYLLATTIMMHSHWGMECVALDYIKKDNFGFFAANSLHWIILSMTTITLAGLYYFIYNDIGISQGIRKIWALKPRNISSIDCVADNLNEVL